MLDDIVEIRELGAVQEAEEPWPERKKRTVTVLKLTEGLGLIEAGIQVFQDINWKEQPAATTGYFRSLIGRSSQQQQQGISGH
jgi:hypothetical protein